ncbi:unnamed protein product [Darwinula stevensoni]|uniref:Tudor domain-containing protein n=1 Tax=Darwinula stevensoni TaxID=69355 RepID=A0A7R9AGQ6_9CRUS|nr:unnamed protein product [Darwinula stevensoni]CAG0904532.1 unnamed protein product [Darwinula stevensoni]
MVTESVFLYIMAKNVPNVTTFRENTIKLLAVHPDGIPMIDFLDLYREKEVRFPNVGPPVPMEAIGPEEKYERQTFNVKFGEYFGAHIGEIYSPDRFYFQFQNFHIEELDRVTDLMDVTYGSGAGTKYKIPEQYIQPEQVVAAVYYPEKTWHRGIIRRVREDGAVDVLFVDYGATVKINRTDLRWLLRRFMKIPAQAFRARLAHICPPDGASKWPKESSERFLTLVKGKVLCAQLVKNTSSVSIQ